MISIETTWDYMAILEALTDDSNQVIYLYDTERRLHYVTPSFKTLTGYSISNLRKKHFINHFHPGDSETMLKAWDQVFSGEEYHGQFRYITKKKAVKWCSASWKPIRDSRGHQIGVLRKEEDITKHKLIEAALIDGEEKYRTILEGIEEGYYEEDLAGNFTFLNDSMCRIYGYSRDDLMGMNYRQYTDTETAKNLFQVFNEIYRTGEPSTSYTYELIRKDGVKRYIEASASLKKNSSGKVMGFRGIIRDATERKHMEEALRQSEERYRTIVEEMQDGYFEVDLAGNFTYVNNAECKNLGYSRDELIGMNNRRYADEKNSKKLYRLFNEIFKTGIPVKAYDLELIKKDGTISYDELSATLIKDIKGKPIGFRGVSRDINERKRMEESLRQSEEKYRTILEEMQEGYFENDLAGNLTFFNDSFCGGVGYVKEELIGMNYKQYTDKENAKKVYQAFAELYKTGEPINAFVDEIIRKDGTTVYSEFSASLIKNTQGEPIGFRGIARDITERKKAEEERKQSFVRLRKVLGATVQSISRTVEMRDPYTSGHQQRVSDLARAIATEMGLSADQQDFIRTAANIHDLGKIAIPSEILSKPTKLTNAEFNLIKTHSQAGYDILKDIEFPWPVADVVLQHHERTDGSGYPQGLKGADILLEAQILAIADVVEAISTHRPYRPALGIDIALKEISENKGILYNADAVDACLKLFSEKGYTLVATKWPIG